MDQQINSFEISTGWIENLALEELNMDESGIVNFDDHLNPVHSLEESSVNFMNQLRDRFEFYVNRFNEYRGGSQKEAQIKIFKISNTINDFMIFRNSLRLILARKATDLITIGFLSSNGELYCARSTEASRGLTKNLDFGGGPHEIRAHIGPFNKITWRFDGEIVEIDPLVKYYLSEFIRNSAR